MPAKKIIEAVTSTLAVIGSSIATATAGPMPGSTPTAVPNPQPTRHQSRLAGEIAVAKPCRRALMISMSEPPGGRQARQIDRQELGEGPEHRRRNRQTGHQVDHDRAGLSDTLTGRASQSLNGQQVAQRATEDEPDGGDQRRVGQQAG